MCKRDDVKAFESAEYADYLHDLKRDDEAMRIADEEKKEEQENE